MLNIFGKLYTLLRRPQPSDTMTASGEWEHVDTPNDGFNTSGTDIDVTAGAAGKDAQEQPTNAATPDVEKLAQQMETLGQGAEGLGRESKAVVGPDGDHTAQSETATEDKQVVMKEPAECHNDTATESKNNKKGDSSSTHDEEPTIKEPTIKEADYPRYSDFVAQMTEHKHLIKPKDLLYKLGYQKDMNADLMEQTVVGQYKLATSKNYWYWVKDARYFAELFFSFDWINEHLPPQGKVGKQRKQKQKSTKNDQRNNMPQEPVRDIRIKNNPNIQVYTGNAAGGGELKAQEQDTKPMAGEKLDGFVTDYTDQVLQHAMKQALDDGLSESLIMEVIDDVVSKDTNTPRKRGKVNKVDLSRTPQKRPDQLAFGFNFHADKLVKDSPVTETGEVLVPGVPPTTPRRKTRDQLAVGFNYHSDVLAKTPVKSDSSDDQDFEVINENMEINENSEVDLKENVPEENGHFEIIDNQQHQERENQYNRSVNSGKTKVKDIFAVGFSYNSDQLLKESLDKVNGNITDEDLVSGCIEEVSRNENESGTKILEEEMPLDNRPAGSVW